MLYHVHVDYRKTANPTTVTAHLRQLVDFSSWMQTQDQYPVKTLSIHWGTCCPEGFGLFEADSAAALSGFLDRLPGRPAFEIAGVESLHDAVAQAALPA